MSEAQALETSREISLDNAVHVIDNVVRRCFGFDEDDWNNLTVKPYAIFLKDDASGILTQFHLVVVSDYNSVEGFVTESFKINLSKSVVFNEWNVTLLRFEGKLPRFKPVNLAINDEETLRQTTDFIRDCIDSQKLTTLRTFVGLISHLHRIFKQDVPNIVKSIFRYSDASELLFTNLLKVKESALNATVEADVLLNADVNPEYLKFLGAVQQTCNNEGSINLAISYHMDTEGKDDKQVMVTSSQTDLIQRFISEISVNHPFEIEAHSLEFTSRNFIKVSLSLLLK